LRTGGELLQGKTMHQTSFPKSAEESKGGMIKKWGTQTAGKQFFKLKEKSTAGIRSQKQRLARGDKGEFQSRRARNEENRQIGDTEHVDQRK